MDEYLSEDYKKLFNKSNTADVYEYPILPQDFTLPSLPERKMTTPSLVQPSIETDQGNGISTFARANAPLVTQSGRFKVTGNIDGTDIIRRIGDFNEAFTRAKFGADGSIEVESAPPRVNENPVGEVRGTEKEPQFFGTPEAYQATLPAPAPEPKSKSFWRKAGEFLLSPTAGYIAGQIGAALATTEGQREFGLSMARLNLDQVYGQYVNELRKGTPPDELLRGNFKILPAEYRNRAAEEMRLEREAQMKSKKFEMEKEAFELDKKSQVVRDEYTAALTAHTKKLTEGILTKEESIYQKNLDRAIQLAVAEYDPHGGWMGLAGGAFNWKTHEFVAITDINGEDRGSPVGKMNPADYKQFEEWVAANYIKEAEANLREEKIQTRVARGESRKEAEKAVAQMDVINEFKDKDTKTWDPLIIKKYLPADRKAAFAKDTNDYLMNELKGVPRTMTQMQQVPFIHTFTEGKYKGQTWEVRAGAVDAQGNVTTLIPIRPIK